MKALTRLEIMALFIVVICLFCAHLTGINSQERGNATNFANTDLGDEFNFAAFGYILLAIVVIPLVVAVWCFCCRKRDKDDAHQHTMIHMILNTFIASPDTAPVQQQQQQPAVTPVQQQLTTAV